MHVGLSVSRSVNVQVCARMYDCVHALLPAHDSMVLFACIYVELLELHVYTGLHMWDPCVRSVFVQIPLARGDLLGQWPAGRSLEVVVQPLPGTSFLHVGSSHAMLFSALLAMEALPLLCSKRWLCLCCVLEARPQSWNEL